MNIRQIPRLKCDLNFGLPVLIVIGIIYSLWTSSYFFLALRFTIGIYDIALLSSIENTYYLLCFSTSLMLFYGFKKCDKQLIRYWYLVKLAECGLVIAAVILYSLFIYDYWPYVTVAIPILSAGWYIITSIQQGYREIGVELDLISISSLFKRPKNPNQNQDEDIDDKTQENLNPFASSTLRDWGFITIFQFVIVAPGIVLIITNTNIYQIGSEIFYNYWNIFWFLAGVGLFFAASTRFVWKMIPKKSSSTNIKEEIEENSE